MLEKLRKLLTQLFAQSKTLSPKVQPIPHSSAPSTPTHNFTPKDMKVRATRDMNVRVGAPTTTAPKIAVTRGTIFSTRGSVSNGEKIGENSVWLKTDAENYVWSGNVEEVITPAPTPITPSLLKLGVANLPQDAMTIVIRKEIADVLNGGKNGWELQCTEYVTYRVKTKLGITINWPVTSGRNGGKWGSIFQQYGTYPVTADPKVNCAMSFTTGISSNPVTNEIGHVAFVEEVFQDGSIKISEANWPRDGIYSERTLSKQQWKDKYKALFTAFN